MAQAAVPPDLVTFARPPLEEVVLGVQFDRDVSDDALALADFWPKIRSDFPRLEKQPPLPKAVEEFGPVASVMPQIEFMPAPPSPRYWFISTDESRLIQLQSDRLLYNWRKGLEGREYPRYRQLRSEFRDRLSGFLDCLPTDTREQLGGLWCEVSYINHFDAKPTSSSARGHRPLSHFLRLVAAPRLKGLPKPEDMQLHQRYVIREHSTPIGRFYVSAVAGIRPQDGSPIHVVTLLARLKPQGGDPDDIFASLDRCRQLVVEGFRDITTPAAHKLWGLEDQ